MHRIANLIGPGAEAHTYLLMPDEAVSPGFRTEVVELGMRVSFGTELDRAVAGLAFVEAGVRAAQAGFAASILNAFGDYGLPLMKTVSPIPVVGAGQASLHAALALGARFGILTVWPPLMRGAYDRLLADNGIDARFTGVRYVTDDDELGEHAARGGFGIELRDEPEHLIDRIEREGRRVLADGADVIVAGCVCMVPICDELQRRLGVPVINPLTAAQRCAEMLVASGPTPLPAITEAQQRVLRAMIEGGALAPAYGSDAECGDACEIVPAGELSIAT